MGTVSPTIYVGHPELIALNGNEVDFTEIDAALEASAATATEITILGGFYNPRALLALCKAVEKPRRRKCSVRIAVGLDAASRTATTWADMRKLRSALVEMKFKSVTVSIVARAPVHFHTKLFRFVHTTRPEWFIGSANPGSLRHELMVRIAGRHEALSAYVDAVFEKATQVDEPIPAIRIATLRDFFLSGFLCHKPPVPRLFTFDAFHFDPAQRERLDKALAGSSAVSHASPKTQGFGFDLRSALSTAEDPFADDATKKSRIQFRPYSIDTVLGWWMPGVYAAKMRSRVSSDESVRAHRLAAFGHALRSEEGERAVRDAFLDPIATMEAFLKANAIHARPIANREIRFERLLSSRAKALTDARTIVRHARSLTLTAMPDIWADGTTVRDFEESFFDDLAFRAAGATQPVVVRSITSRLGGQPIATSSEFRKAVKSRIARKPWSNEFWK